jgi:uncharacterized protein YacL
MRLFNILLGVFGMLLGLYLSLAGPIVIGSKTDNVILIVIHQVVAILLIFLGVSLFRRKTTLDEDKVKVNIPRAVLLAFFIFFVSIYFIFYSR